MLVQNNHRAISESCPVSRGFSGQPSANVHSTDAFKRKADDTSHTADAYKNSAGTFSHTTDSNKRQGEIQFHTTDALLVKSFVNVHSTDAFLRMKNTVDEAPTGLWFDSAHHPEPVEGRPGYLLPSLRLPAGKVGRERNPSEAPLSGAKGDKPSGLGRRAI